jgi:hypothetical protein
VWWQFWRTRNATPAVADRFPEGGEAPIEVSLFAEGIPPDILKSRLEDQFARVDGLTFKLGAAAREFRTLEPPVLVALVGAGGTVLGAMIAGLLSLQAQRGGRKVVIRGRSGRTIELPADTPKELIDEYLQKAREIDIERIEL